MRRGLLLLPVVVAVTVAGVSGSTAVGSGTALVSRSTPSRPARVRTTSRPRADGGVWYTAQGSGRARLARPDDRRGRRDPARRRLGAARRDRRAGRCAVDHRRRPERDRPRRPARRAVCGASRCPPSAGYANLNTATFDRRGRALVHRADRHLRPARSRRAGRMHVFDAPRGPGPYGITTTPRGDVYYASLAGNYVGRIDSRTGKAAVLDPPTRGPGRAARLVRLAGPDLGQRVERGPGRQLRPGNGRWREWRLPGPEPAGRTRSTSTTRTSSGSATSARTPSCASTREPQRSRRCRSRAPGRTSARSSAGRGEVWGAESGADKLVVVRTS